MKVRVRAWVIASVVAALAAGTGVAVYVMRAPDKSGGPAMETVSGPDAPATASGSADAEAGTGGQAAGTPAVEPAETSGGGEEKITGTPEGGR